MPARVVSTGAGNETYSTFINNWHDFTERNGFTGVRPYALRHTFATINLENGVSIKTISTDMGHRDPAYTLSLYVGYLPSAVPVSQLYADAFDKMCDSGIIAGAAKGPDEPEPKQRPVRFSKRVPEKPRKNPSFYPSRGGKAR